MNREKLLEQISIRPDVCAGVPVIRGTRVMVSIILDSLAEGASPEEIIDHFPNITKPDIQTAIAFARSGDTAAGIVSAYSAGRIGRYQVQKLLGFDNRWDTENWLYDHGAVLPYGIEELESDMKTLERLKSDNQS